MTGAEFNDRFQLVRQVTDGRVRTFHAVASTGAVVMVHIVDAGAAEESLALAELLGRLDPVEKPRILDVTEVDGSPVIITKFILEFTSLRDWLESHAIAETGNAAAPARPEPGPAVAPPPPAEPGAVPTHQERESDAPGDAGRPGEFTRLFRGVSPPPAEPAPPAQPTPPAPPAQAPPPAKEPGEFTREFMRAAQPPAPPAPPASATPPASAAPPPPVEPTPPAQSPPPAHETGEFTRMFLSAAPESGSPPAPPPPPADVAPPRSAPEPPAPTSFTQIFQSPFAGGTGAQEAGPGEPRREGEFTRMLRVASGLTGSGGAPAASPPPPNPPQPLEPTPPPPPPPVTQPPPRTPATPKSNEPGEFTRWFARQADPSPPAPGSTPDFGIGGGSQPPPGGGGPDWLSRLRDPGSAGPSHTAGPPPAPGPRAPAGPWSPPPAAPPQAGPGEYTRIFSAPPAPPPSPLPPPPPAPVKGPSRKLLIWGLVGIVVLTLLLIVLFAVLSRAGQPDAPAGDPAPADSAAATAPAAGR